MKQLALVFFVVAVALLGVGALFWVLRSKATRAAAVAHRSAQVRPGSESEPKSGDSVTYAPPEFEWSGNSNGTLPLKVLTYKQYECLEDARYGFKILARKPTEIDAPLPEKTRGHGLKTVASLSKHGFLSILPEGAYVITDHGLNALATCNIRY